MDRHILKFLQIPDDQIKEYIITSEELTGTFSSNGDEDSEESSATNKKTKAIYAWYLVPVNNLNLYRDLLNIYSTNKTVLGKDKRTQIEVEVNIDEQAKSLSGDYDKLDLKNLKDEYLRILVSLIPPIYIGMTENLNQRLADHSQVLREVLKPKFHSLSSIEEGDFESESIEFARTLYRHLDEVYLDMPKPSYSSVFVKCFEFTDQNISRSNIYLLERLLIDVFQPIGNTKI